MPPSSRYLLPFFLAGALAHGQAPTVPPRVVPATPVSAGPRASRLPSQPLDMDQPLDQGITFQGQDVRDVGEYYQRLSGKRVIVDVQAVGQINLAAKLPLTRGEALELVEVALLMNGFTMVHLDDGTVKLLGQSRNPRGFGIPIITDELQIPEGERIVTFIFKLKYADPTEVSQLLGQYIVQGQTPYNQTTPLPKAQAIVLTENSLIIRKLLQIIKEVDVPPAEAVSEFITLERADAKDVLEKLEKIFEKNQQQQAQGGQPVAAGVPRPVQRQVTTPEGTPIPADATVQSTGPNSVEINGGSLSEESIIIGKIKLTADTRTNRLHIITRPINLNFIKQLVKEFDADIPFGEPASRPLRFVAAHDIFPTVVDAITEPGQKAEGSGGGGGSRSSSGRRSSTGTDTNTLTNNNSLNGLNNGFGGGGFGGSGSGSQSFSESLSTDERETTPEAKIIGNTKIIADNRSNTIIVLGNKEVKNKIFALLDQLDVRQPQVMIHAIIGELNLSQNRTLGVNYVAAKGGTKGLLDGATVSNNNNGNNGNDSTGTGSALSITGGNPVLNLAGLLTNQGAAPLLAAGSGGFSGFVTAGDTLAALIDALESTNRFKVVSRPSIFTTNNKKAVISSGEEIAVPTSINAGFNGGSVGNNGLVTNSSISYKTVALQLEVLPLINNEREVTLEIVQKVDQQSGSDIIDNNSIPRIATRVLKTTVTVPNGGTLVLGGLIKQTDNKTLSGIPYLSRIPVLGSLFRRTVKDQTRTELVILLRPVVTAAPEEDMKLREKSMEYLNVETDLESTVYPPNLRKKTSPEMLPRRAPIQLREEDPPIRRATPVTPVATVETTTKRVRR